jgi:ribA/ribD-fused uncharacterized protein
MKYNTQWLSEKLQQDETVDYNFFWGHKAAKDNSITKSCFSQWWPSAFTVDGIEYKTAEHWMMAKKAELFNDAAMLDAIIKTDKPGSAKSFGRKVKNFDAAIWDAHSFSIVVEGNRHKFSQHPALENFLLKTNNEVLVEASPVGFIWGIGMGKDHVNAINPEKWRGKNLLGFALMEVRDLFK